MKHIALVLALLMIVASADAALTRTLKGTLTGDDLYRWDIISVPIEDEDMRHSMIDGSPGDTPGSGTGGSMVVGPETAWGDYGHYTSLIGIPDMISYLPQNENITSGDDIVSATFRVSHRSPSGGEIIGVHAVTSPWLSTGAQTVFTALHRVAGGEDPYWLADIGKTPVGGTDYSAFVGFSSADYDASSGGQFTISDTTSRTYHDIDITQIVRDWVDGVGMGNQGLCMVWEYVGTWPYADAPYFNTSDPHSSWDRLPDGSNAGPEFVIVYAPEPVTIGLLVVGGLALIRRKR
jgi:hypothetical protein